MSQHSVTQTRSTLLESVHEPSARIPMHRHREAYAALVLDGSYEERSVDGFFKCSTGDLVIHPPLHAHKNCFPSSGATIVNFPVRVHDLGDYIVLSLSSYEELERLARQNPAAAGEAALEEAAHRKQSVAPKWMSDMADALRDDSALGRRTNLALLATELNISPQHASRAFGETFGVSPNRFRNEQRLRRALCLLREGACPSRAAYESGFADQSHFNRAMKQLTGHTPREWKASNTTLKSFNNSRADLRNIPST